MKYIMALGAAYLAGLAVGFFGSRAEIAKNWNLDRVFTPAMAARTRADKLAGWKRAVDCAIVCGDGQKQGIP